MSNVEERIRCMEEMLQKLVIVVDKHLPRPRHPSAKSRKQSQSPWNTIRPMIEALVKDIKYVKAVVEGSDVNTGHDRNTGAHNRNMPPEAALQILTPPHERQQLGEPSADTAAPTTVPTTVHTTVEAPEVEENTTVDVTMPRRLREPVSSTMPPSDASTYSVSEIPRNPGTIVPYREEHGIVVLMPLDMDQCRDTRFLLSQAEMLGARQTGIFKYVLPGDFDFSAEAAHSVTTCVSSFTSGLGQDGIFCISRQEKLETLDISHTRTIPTEPDELAEMLERRLADPEAVSKMRYCTDTPAWTAEDRRRLGLPAESLIWPLKDNLLDHTKYIVDGLHRPYGYLSGEDGSVFTIHREDANLISLNALYSGKEKSWCAVAQKDGYLVENAVKGGKCAQRVRHASRWIPRSKLKAMGASFVTFVQRPGEVVLVWGDIYHQGGTVGPTTAEAVNYGGPEWSIKGYSDCSRTCPGPPISNAILEFRSPNELQREQDDAVSTGSYSSVQSQGHKQLARNRRPAPTRSGETARTEFGIDKQGKGPRKRHGDVQTAQQSRKKAKVRTTPSPADTIMNETKDVTDLVSRMVAAIQSRDAIKQFFDIVQGRRDTEPGFRMNSITSPSKRQIQSEDPTRMVENDMNVISMLSCKTAFHGFLTRLFQVRLADHVDKLKGDRLRSETAVIADILRRTGMSNRQYLYHREKGEKWRKYHKAFPGILCFIPVGNRRSGFSSSSWLDLNERIFAFLCSRLDDEHTSALCVAGRAFEHSLDPTADDVDFIWESQNVSLDRISKAKLLSTLELFPAKHENVYDPNAYPDWPRPDEWPDDSPWPVDPTSLPPSGGVECKVCHRSNCPCELCHRGDCQCAAIRHKTQPRIRDYTRKYQDKNRGLQAVAWEAGQIVYSEGDIIDFITGELSPPDMYANGRCIQVDRSDILGEPTVAQINCAKCGSVYRLANSSCDPSARFRGMRVSGKFRIAIVAARNIFDGEEITVYYGKRYWGRAKCRCPVCRARLL
ncbi:hypothetical protein Z517_06459 [Fonsecaea pedrosoi CBS 271.37]|uniref:SET domain-containing protein n=1 Tax=Fonsecaea pedrosoi CBS 271.37 TaxID=1442368 RepID=A0A0D2H587_9EURO|nr:uncharacterized protein Z517_06459 [Fonsecaea pedrosoi CBS 271.37]KIW79844.1 hypothetical protein Z517_06459 [Fonsecaea pedrosoi CBS 271.37]